jgi:hypothetical protein
MVPHGRRRATQRVLQCGRHIRRVRAADEIGKSIPALQEVRVVSEAVLRTRIRLVARRPELLPSLADHVVGADALHFELAKLVARVESVAKNHCRGVREVDLRIRDQLVNHVFLVEAK